jgi:hypothetical protein
MKVIVALTVFAACHYFLPVPALAANELRLVAEGKAESVIVFGTDPSGAAVQGAKIFTEHVLQMSGAKLDTVREDALAAGERRVRICIGESKMATALGVTSEGLGPGGIAIKAFPDQKALVILGADHLAPVDSNGTRYAVTTFLEEVLGVRFLWPGELGKVVPKRDTIEITAIDVRMTPLLIQRKIRMAGSWSDRMQAGGERLHVSGEEFAEIRKAALATDSEDSGWSGWHRLGGSLRLASGHSYGDYWERFGKEHPEWFAMAPNGSRDQSASGSRARLCVSNEKLIGQIARDRIAHIEKTADTSVAIGPNDGGTTSFCVCDECEKLDAPSERKITLIDFSPGANRRSFEHVPLTDRYVHFFNGIAEKVTAVHPDVWLTADAYSTYSAPPVKAKLHPNIAIRYVGVTYLNEARRHQGVADWNAWAAAAKKIYFRSNLLLAGRRQGTPAIYPRKLAEDFGKIAHNSMIGTDLDSCMNNWATQGLNYYVMAKLLWDPDLDVEALIDDYCRAGFGAGADAVKRYLLRLEQLTDEIAAKELTVTKPYTPEVVDELRALLDEAALAVASDAKPKARVEFLRVGLEYTDAYCDIYRIDREWQEIGGRLSLEMKERARRALDRNWEASRDIFENHPLAVNVANVAWGSWGYFKKFQWKDVSPEVLAKWE